jgi:hypothetical protein
VQAQPHVVPGGQYEPQRRRRPHQQEFKLAQRLIGVQLVHVVDHQPQPPFQRRQVVEQPFHQSPPVQVRRRRHRPHQLRARPGPRRAPTTDSQKLCGFRKRARLARDTEIALVS